MAKRAYTFAEATREQMDEQSILSDSQKNGGLNIAVADLAKQDDMDYVKEKLGTDIPDEFTLVKQRLTAIENFLNGKKFLLADDQ